MSVEFSWPTVMYGMRCFLVSGWPGARLNAVTLGRVPRRGLPPSARLLAQGRRATDEEPGICIQGPLKP
ncbi:hypothetical protein SY2F82_19870 [Streptomyces sp. Y2F8-2]|nr:hypothetical protein SY2F82_19870 [Streptomyces sp. Y2F8-2]